MKMESIEGLSNKADILLDQCSDLLLHGTCGNIYGQSLYRKLAGIYAEEANKPTKVKFLSLTHRLLEKVVKRENLGCLIVSLYKGNEGFSLAVKLASGIETETVRMPYEDDEFLSYLGNEQLPPMILDLLDESNLDIYHAGCVVVELRDYRRSCDASFDSRYILLRPTNQSLLADISAMTRDKDWTSEERALLEAELVKKTAPPLNLSPSPLVTIVNNKIHQHKYKFSTVPLKRAAKRYTQVSQNRQKKFEEGPAPKTLKLLNFLNTRKDKKPIAKTIPKPQIPTIIDDIGAESDRIDKGLSTVGDIGKFYRSIGEDVAKNAKVNERPPDNVDNTLVFVEEYTLETERGQGRIYLTKVTISQRKIDEIYFGELYVDRDYQEGKHNGSTCKFQLGSLHQVRRYIQQFKEIFTEEGRKSVKIRHQVAGQPPLSIYAHGSRDKKDLAEQSKQQQQQHPGIVPNITLSTHQIVSSGISTQPILTTPQQSLLILANGDGGLKKSVMVSKPITMTTSTGIIGNQNTTNTSGPQVTVLSNLLAGRTASANGANVVMAAHAPQGLVQGTKMTSVSTGLGTTKFSLPSLTAQLNRPVPSYSQAISPVKHQQIKTMVSTESTTNHAPGLKALLAGTPSADNPAPQPRTPSLLERLTAQSSSSGSITKAEDGIMRVAGSTLVQSSAAQSANASTSAVASVLRSDSGAVGPPPNINIANITNIPGLNVGLPSLQNVQVSIGVPVPISLSLNMPNTGGVVSSTGGMIITSSPITSNVLSNSKGTTTVSSAATVMIASPSSLQQGQVVQLPLSQISGSQLAAQLTKSGSSGGATSSGIPILQVQGMGGQLFTSVRGASSAGCATVTGSVVGTTTTSALQPQTVQVALPVSQTNALTGADVSLGGTLVQSSGTGVGTPQAIVKFTSKQQLQLAAVQKQGTNKLNLQLQQKLMAVKRNLQQQ